MVNYFLLLVLELKFMQSIYNETGVYTHLLQPLKYKYFSVLFFYHTFSEKTNKQKLKIVQLVIVAHTALPAFEQGNLSSSQLRLHSESPSLHLISHLVTMTTLKTRNTALYYKKGKLRLRKLLFIIGTSSYQWMKLEGGHMLCNSAKTFYFSQPSGLPWCTSLLFLHRTRHSCLDANNKIGRQRP